MVKTYNQLDYNYAVQLRNFHNTHYVRRLITAVGRRLFF